MPLASSEEDCDQSGCQIVVRIIMEASLLMVGLVRGREREALHTANLKTVAPSRKTYDSGHPNFQGGVHS